MTSSKRRMFHGDKCQTMDAVYDCHMPLHQNGGKSTLGWQKGNGRKGIIIRKTHSITNYIHMGEAMCGI